MTNTVLIGQLASYNPTHYNITKALEEMAELSTVLAQKLNKRGSTKEPSDDIVAEELGDTIIRLRILTRQIGSERVRNRIAFKLSKYRTLLATRKYSTI